MKGISTTVVTLAVGAAWALAADVPITDHGWRTRASWNACDRAAWGGVPCRHWLQPRRIPASTCSPRTRLVSGLWRREAEPCGWTLDEPSYSTDGGVRVGDPWR